MKKVPITAVILTHNEEAMLPSCLASLSWCSHIVVVDQHSTDSTATIARVAGAVVIESQETSFAARRTAPLSSISTEWLVYVDPDERVTPELARSIGEFVSDFDSAESNSGVGLVSRKNFYYGSELHFGGWLEPGIARVFKRTALQGWSGVIHESPLFDGAPTQLGGELWHFSHRSVVAGLRKSAEWTPLEAKLLFDAGISPVTWLTVMRKGLGELWRRGFLQRGFKDGQTGMMEILIQAINRMLIYLQVWELQHKPPIPTVYEQLESEVTKLWKEA